MASTYVNDLRLEEMATGDQSGTWGDTTNTNLELIAEAFSYGTEASFGSDADATTTIADGASDPARSLYLKVTSGASLTATRTLTIAPNTVSKIWIIENATSGSQSINISQGSGANVTIPNGDVKVIYTDGAGAGAAVVDAFTDLNLSGTTTVAALDAGSGAITTTGTVTGGTLTGTLSTAAQPNITSVGTLTGLTGGTGDLNWDSGTLFVDSSADAVGIGTTSPSYKLEVESSSDADLIQIQSTASANNTVLRLGISGDVATLNASGGSTGALAFKTYGSEKMRIDSSGKVGIGTASVDQHLHVEGSGTQAIKVETTADDYAIMQYKTSTSSLWQSFASPSNDYRIGISGVGDALTIDSSFNVGIGTTSPSSEFHVKGDATTLARIEPNDSSGKATLLLSSTSVGDGGIQYDSNSNLMHLFSYSYMTFNVGTGNIGGGYPSNERMRIDSSGSLIIGKTATTNNNDAGIYMLSSGAIVATRSGDIAALFNRTSSDGNVVLFRKDNSTVGQVATKDGDMALGTGDTGLRFIDGSDAITPQNITTNAGRDNAIDLGTSGARFKDLYLSGGAYIGGTAAGNKLDDYEEGSFTPSLTDGTNSVSLGTSYYTKIGNIVTVWISAYNTDFSSLTAGSALRVSGLPFSADRNSQQGIGTNTTSGYQVVTELSTTNAYIYLNNGAVDYAGFSRTTGVGGASTFSFRTIITYSTGA